MTKRFECTDSGKATGRDETSGKRTRATASAYCPKCARQQKVGLVDAGTHLVWRVHNMTTWGGSSTPCIASGVSLCVTGVDEGRMLGLDSPACYCQSGRNRRINDIVSRLRERQA